MPKLLGSRAMMSLGGLSPVQVAAQMWKRMEEHDAMTWAAAVAFYAMLATVPFLALLLVAVVLRLPDLSRGGSATGLGDLTVDQLEATLRSLFPTEAYVVVRDEIVHIQNEPPFALLSPGAVISLWSASSLFLVPALRQLQQVAGSARRGHGAVVLVLGRGLGALGSGRNR